MHFVTPICHPNVLFKTGEICLDILKEAWTPIWTLESSCRAVIAMLAAPEASSPLNCDAGNLLRAGDTRGFNALARCNAFDYATILPPPTTATTTTTASSASIDDNDDKSKAVSPPSSSSSSLS
jgi:hypothetical protein